MSTLQPIFPVYKINVRCNRFRVGAEWSFRTPWSTSRRLMLLQVREAFTLILYVLYLELQLQVENVLFRGPVVCKSCKERGPFRVRKIPFAIEVNHNALLLQRYLVWISLISQRSPHTFFRVNIFHMMPHFFLFYLSFHTG